MSQKRKPKPNEQRATISRKTFASEPSSTSIPQPLENPFEILLHGGGKLSPENAREVLESHLVEPAGEYYNPAGATTRAAATMLIDLSRQHKPLSKQKKQEGAETTKNRPKVFENELYTFVARLLNNEPHVLNENPSHPHIPLAARVRTQDASESSLEHKYWNKRADKRNAAFLSERYVRAAITKILPELIRAAPGRPNTRS